MKLTDSKVRTAKATQGPCQLPDGEGLLLDLLPGGAKAWRLRYRLLGKPEKITLGKYPGYSLADARAWRAACKALVSRGVSPRALKRGEGIPDNLPPAARDLALNFVRDWCPKARAKAETAKLSDTVEVFAKQWLAEMVAPKVRDTRDIKRALDKDIVPAIGAKQLADVSVTDVLAITDRIKKRGANQVALLTRNVLKRLFEYAVAREKTKHNPAAAIGAKYIAQVRSRDVALSADEIGELLRGLEQSTMSQANKLAVHLLVITLVRKSELLEAGWEEFDLENALWTIPGERMKKDKSHLVPLSRQAVEMFKELKRLAGGAAWILPGRERSRPIAPNTLNVAVGALAPSLKIKKFVLHDFRRTASTLLHEAGFSPDWIEKALAHEAKGVRGVYNKAEYAEQRRQMLQWWADFVEVQKDGRGKVIIGAFGKEASYG